MAVPETKEQRLNRWKKAERIVLLPVLLVAVAAFFTLGRVEVLGNSMNPTLRDGQRLIVLRKWRLMGPLKVGDVVVVEAADRKHRDAQIIKRIAFLQNADGTLPWPATLPTSRGPQPTERLFDPQSLAAPVPKSGILVLGDNIGNSTDSRDFGPIFEREIFGRVFVP